MTKNGHPSELFQHVDIFLTISKKTLQALHGISEAVNFITVFSIECDARRRGRGPQQGTGEQGSGHNTIALYSPAWAWRPGRELEYYRVCDQAKLSNDLANIVCTRIGC